MTLPDQLTLARALAVPVVVVLFAWDFPNHAYWATAVFALAMATDQVDGWLARRRNQTSAFGSLLDPIADKVLVLAALVMLIGEGVAPAWMVAAIVAREIAVSGLRLAAHRAWRGDRRPRPRQAQDVVADGRPRRSPGSRPPARGTPTSPGGRCSSQRC